jgi:L,D-transpeptidase YcbB
MIRTKALWLVSVAGLAGPAFAQQAAPQIQPPRAPATAANPQMVQAVPAPVQIPPLSDAQATELRELLANNARVEGLRSANDTRLQPVSTAQDALVAAALDHARAVHAGRLAEEDFQEDWALRPKDFDPRPGFAKAVAENRIGQWFASLPPPWAGYDGLKTGLQRYRQIVADGGWSSVPAGPDLSVGSSGARVAALRKRLAVEDKTVSATGDRFDAALKEAVVRAQRRYGLNPSGLVSTQTLAALNVPAQDRVRQIMANMERWRWMPHELPANRIQVNIAAAVVTVFEGDKPVMSMRGVTGKVGTETPMLSSTIHSIVLNPPWNVPARIAREELFPKGMAYLKANDFRVIGTGPNRRLQQIAGPKAALGRFKFDFDNEFAVYLHDTPAKAGFGRFDRLESHGCIRLEKPHELANYLLRTSSEWSEAKVQETLDSGKTVRAQLTTPAEVYLLYWTAFASANGDVNFRADPYGWDAKLADKIEARQTRQIAAR